jgi:hypothetical protein
MPSGGMPSDGMPMMGAKPRRSHAALSHALRALANGKSAPLFNSSEWTTTSLPGCLNCSRSLPCTPWNWHVSTRRCVQSPSSLKGMLPTTVSTALACSHRETCLVQRTGRRDRGGDQLTRRVAEWGNVEPERIDLTLLGDRRVARQEAVDAGKVQRRLGGRRGGNW